MKSRSRVGADVAIDLVAPRVPHRFDFRELVRVLALADRRVIARRLLDPAVAQLVEPRVADVADNRAPLLDDHHRENARHPAPFLAHRRHPVDFVVRDGDGLADTIGKGAGLALETCAQHLHRDVRGLAAGSLAADAVDNDEQAAGDVVVEPVLVDLALQAGVRVACGFHRGDDLHDALNVPRARAAAR
jgi:hypothetical protein